MAQLENKNVEPVIALVANWFVAGILGYVLIGQTSKGVMVFLATLLGVFLCFIPGMLVSILALIDVYQVAEAVKNGEAVDENEYKNELLYKIVKNLHGDAIFKGASDQAE